MRAVTPADVAGFVRAVAEGRTARRVKTSKKGGLSNVRGGNGAATRTVGLLFRIFAYAVERGMRPDNPVHGVKRFAGRKRERRLSDGEYAALGKGIYLAAELEAHGGNSGSLVPPTCFEIGSLLSEDPQINEKADPGRAQLARRKTGPELNGNPNDPAADRVASVALPSNLLDLPQCRPRLAQERALRFRRVAGVAP